MREQPVPVLLGVKKRGAGAHEQLGAERKAGGIERGGDNAERGQRALLVRAGHRMRQISAGAEQQQQAGSGQRKSGGQRDDPARGGERRFQRDHHQPDRSERSNAAGAQGDQRRKRGQRQRGQHVRAFIAAGARQVIDDQDGRREPGEDADLERSRHAANDDIDGKTCQRGKTAEQTRGNEGAMARRRQRILLRRRVHQRIDIIPYWREETHGPCHTSRRNRRAPKLACETLGHSQLSER